jgi:putative membrane protein
MSPLRAAGPIPLVGESVIRRVWKLMVLLGAYSLALVLLDRHVLHESITLPATMFAVLGSVLSMLLIFRTNTAYDRWWEGRKLWGQLVNDSRNLCLKVRSLHGVDADEAYQLARMLVNFARALKEHLRDGIRTRQLTLYQRIEVPEEPKHVPIHIAGLVRNQIAQWRREGRIDGFEELILDPHFRALMDICGACERIRRTPISLSYRRFLRRCIGLYVLTLPWGLVEALLYWTVPTVMVTAYFMVGLELIAEDVEEPFGRGEDDLLLDEICRNLEVSLEEIVRDPRIQRPEVPVGEK